MGKCVGTATKPVTCTAAGGPYTLGGCEKKCFFVKGECDVENNCISSKNYPNNYGNGEHCMVKMLQDCDLKAETLLEVEAQQDHLKMNNQDIESIGQFPAKLPKDNEWMWSTSMSNPKKGWKLCFKPSARRE